MNQEIPVILPYEGMYANEILRIANRAFGEGYMEARHLEEIESGEGAFYIAKTREKIVGYCFFPYVSAAVCADHIKLPESLILQNADSDRRVCLTKSMAVTAQYRGAGLADKLFSACLRDTVAAGLSSAWGSAWKIGDRVPMRRIFDDNGFQVYGEIPLIWYDVKQYRCVVCGGPCRCTGVIYYKLFGM